MKKILPVLIAMFAATLFVSAAAPALAATANVPAPRILIVDREAILQYSKVGQDISRQVQAYAAQAKKEMAAQGQALQAEGQKLQQQIAILSPDAKQKRIQAFQAKESALQSQAQRRQAEIQGGVMKAQQSVEQALGPILAGLLQQRGANMILDKQAVVFANASAFDVTQAVIDQLNSKMSSLKVSLVQPPTGTK
jgi:Skp family chaperone for outer membrane proteins